MSKIGYVPIGAKVLNDVLWLDNTMLALSKYARNHFPVDVRKLSNICACKNCEQITRTDIHHIKPVWVYSVETVIAQNPKTDYDLTPLFRAATFGEIHILQCNKLDNLRRLCHGCHTQSDKENYRYWKAQLMEQRPLVFGNRSIKRIRELMSQAGV
jgi:hypothetical protein